MAVGPGSVFPLPAVAGARLSSMHAGIRKKPANDLVLIELAEQATTAAVFTRNAFCAAPVSVARRNLGLAPGRIRYLLINAGNANAGTGDEGVLACERCCESLARITGVDPTQILPFSTGVIGEPLPDAKIVAALPTALAQLSEENWELAARGIMTTDTRAKGASRRVEIDGTALTVNGIAKGAGMICPDMATMLAYIVTDAGIETDLLRELLDRACALSFNCITVDGDTSTNDACVLVATGASGVRIDSIQTPACEALSGAIEEIALELAQQIVRDAEGATKFVTVRIQQALDVAEARRCAYTIAHSPLVKTALFARDPNWGRILAALGRAGLKSFDLRQVVIDLNEVRIVAGGARAAGYTEARGQSAMQGDEIEIRVSLGRGEEAATVWTSDLSHEYVRINAEYRT